MSLGTSVGWRRLARISFFVLSPVIVWAIVFAIVDLRGFMSFPLAQIGLLAGFVIPYALGSVADAYRERELRDGDSPDADGSPLVLGTVGQPGSASAVGGSASKGSFDRGWLVVVVAVAVVAYCAFRVYQAVLSGASGDLIFLCPFAVAVLVLGVSPSFLGSRRFERAVASLRLRGSVWPAFRTTRFVDELRASRPGARVTRDLVLFRDTDSVRVYTAEMNPRLLVSMPLDGATSISVVAVTERSGSLAIELSRTQGGQVLAFDVIPRRTGPFTYFRAGESYVRKVAVAIGGRSAAQRDVTRG